MSIVPSLLFVEPVVDELRERVHGRRLVLPGDNEQDRAALGRGQGQDPQDALAVDLRPVLVNADGGAEPVGEVDELDRARAWRPSLFLMVIFFSITAISTGRRAGR
jgi:hypothetical protein